MRESTKKRWGRRDLTEGPLLGNLLRLAAPTAAAMVLQSLYQMVDLWWLGRMEPTETKLAFAALTASGPMFFLIWALVMGFSTAGTALVSQHTGAGNHREASRAAGQTMMFLCLTSLSIVVPLLVVAPAMFRLFSVPDNVLPVAVVYMRVALLGTPFLVIHMGYAAVLRALGDTVTPLMIVAVSNLFNALLDPVLIHGLGPVPPMGVAGAALATATAQVLAAVMSIRFMRRGAAGLHVSAADLRPHGHTLRQIFSIGTPAAINMSSNSFGFVLFQWMINLMGPAVMGAFGLSFRVLHFFGIPGPAMATAAAPVVGQALGADKPELAKRAVATSVKIVAIFLLPPIAAITIWGGTFAGFFTEDQEIIRESARFFKIIPFSLYFFMVLMVLTAAFNGSGHTRPPMMVTFLRWMIRLPVAFLLAFPFEGNHEWLDGFGAGLGSTGIYWSMVIANVVCATVLVILFLRGDWLVPVVRRAGLQIRRYRPEDHDAVSKIHRLALAPTGADIGPGPWDADLVDVERVYIEPGGEFLVGELYGDIVAMGALKLTGAGHAEIRRMRVLPAFQRRGFGRAMLTALENHAIAAGCTKLHADTTALQPAALHLYRTSDYVETRREPCGDTETVFFEKRLERAMKEEPEA